MKKLLLMLTGLVVVSQLQAIENRYFSLQLKAQKWLNKTKIQEALKDTKTKAVLIELLEKKLAENHDSDDCDCALCSCPDEYENLAESMFGIIDENAGWVRAKTFDIEIQLHELLSTIKAMKGKRKELSSEQVDLVLAQAKKLEEQMLSHYTSKKEYKAVEKQAEKIGITEACTYLLGLIKAVK